MPVFTFGTDTSWAVHEFLPTNQDPTKKPHPSRENGKTGCATSTVRTVILRLGEGGSTDKEGGGKCVVKKTG